MSILLDTEFLLKINYRLPQFKKISNNIYNFRCPFCGDSQKNTKLKRGYVFKNNKRDQLAFKCHNCTESMSFFYMLKRLDAQLHKEYIFENVNFYKTQTKKPKQIAKKDKVESIAYTPNAKLNKFAARNKNNKYTTSLITINDLDNSHPAKEYLIKRNIEVLGDLYYCDNFVDYVNKLIPNKFSKWFEDKRIIIPLINTKDEWFGFQGRSLDPNCEKRYRYFTIIVDSTNPKVYGANKIDPGKKVTIVEGPFDSMFIDNCLAACGASIDTIEADTYMLDNEPRNKDICRVMEKLLSRGKNVVILDSLKYCDQDVNDMILNGSTKEDIEKLIKDNSFSGMSGKIKMKQWRKC